jgi:hypothetical protein
MKTADNTPQVFSMSSPRPILLSSNNQTGPYQRESLVSI